MEAPPVIALDGPGGSGKGTVGRRLAQRLGWHFLDSGALYRVLAVQAGRCDVSLADEARLAALARELPVAFRPGPGGEEARVVLGGDDVTAEIRSEACGDRASQVAQLPTVRAALLQCQRACRRPPGLVADGRDMGSVVFPDAQHKIFLTASVAERAQRRHKQLKEKGLSANLPTLLDEIAQRDARDAARAVAPLRPAPDATVLDTTELGIEEVVDRILRLL